MTPESFVKNIKSGIIESNSQIYREMFYKTSLEDATDEYFKKALTFFSELPEDKRAVFFRIIKQIEIDTVSNLLGVIDGTCTLVDNQKTTFKLVVNETSEVISGCLQDSFLEMIENEWESL